MTASETKWLRVGRVNGDACPISSCCRANALYATLPATAVPPPSITSKQFRPCHAGAAPPAAAAACCCFCASAKCCWQSFSVSGLSCCWSRSMASGSRSFAIRNDCDETPARSSEQQGQRGGGGRAVLHTAQRKIPTAEACSRSCGSSERLTCTRHMI